MRLGKETKAIKDRILRDTKNLFEHEKKEENYYKSVRINNFWSNNCIEYESISDRNKTHDNIEIMINDEANEIIKELFGITQK